MVVEPRVGHEDDPRARDCVATGGRECQAPVTRLLERYAERYLVLVLLIAAGTWFLTSNTVAMLAVLVASCPCALVLAAPATSIAAIAVASRHGILVKGTALENLATVDAVVFDKTGTVTLGQLHLVEARPEPGVDRHELITLAGNLGAASNHPVSRAACSSGRERPAGPARGNKVEALRSWGDWCGFQQVARLRWVVPNFLTNSASRISTPPKP